MTATQPNVAAAAPSTALVVATKDEAPGGWRFASGPQHLIKDLQS